MKKKHFLIEFAQSFFRKMPLKNTALAFFVVLMAQFSFAINNKHIVSDPSDVIVIDNGTTVTLKNGIVNATITKSNATVSSLIYNGIELIKGGYRGGSIYWSWNMPSYQNPSGCTYSLVTNPSTNNFDLAEIKLHMTWNGTTTTAAMDVDVYYSLQRDTSGLYASATLFHPASYPANPGGEWRMSSYPNPRFDWLSVDSLRNFVIPSGSATTAAIVGAPAENVLITSGPFKNKYECKYDYSADFGAIDTWGWSSTADNVGLWVTTPSKEYYPGGPMKRELMCHSTPVLLNMIGGTHYGQGDETGVAAGEDWQKTYGPFLIYCNKVAAGTTNASIALWEDAKAKAKTEQAAWPYSWHNNPIYIKDNGRGSVNGKLVINDTGYPSAAAADTWVGLAIPPTGSTSVTNFQAWSKNYQFWVKTDANGNFSIPNVIPGTYSLFAFGPGAIGQLSLSNYANVTAGNTTALGTVSWAPTRIAPTIWEIGTPDRTASEFKHGTDWWTSNTYPNPNWAKFLDYSTEFPNDVNFTIGQSNSATDWNYVQPSRNSIPISDPKWNVNFNLTTAPTTGSQASVYVALAANFGAALILSVNGVNVTSPSTGVGPGNDSNAMIRKGIHGSFAEVRYTFPASNLHAGANKISFSIRKTGGGSSGEVMYDYIRLEASGSVLSVGSLEKKDWIKAFPNPTRTSVTLSIPDSSTLEKIEIYNSLGQLMATETKNIISLEKLISGNYYLLIATSKGNYIKKIIRQ
jgi:rhamnogalacturonan endolyase